MTKSFNVEATLLSAVHPHISKHTNVLSILLSLVVVLAGIVSIVLSFNVGKSSSTWSMALLTLGIILILVALYRAFWKSTEIVYIPTGSTINEGSYFVDSADLTALRNVMTDKSFGQSDISFKQGGNGRIDYMASKDGKFMAVQLFQFVPYTYEPASEIYYYVDADAQAFRHFLETRAE